MRFAIIDPNILACLGLKDLLLRLMPTVEIDLFTNAQEFVLPEICDAPAEGSCKRGQSNLLDCRTLNKREQSNLFEDLCKREQSSLLELPSAAKSRQSQLPSAERVAVGNAAETRHSQHRSVLPDLQSGSREYKDLQSARPSEYLHYFVASRIFFEQAAFFRSHNRRVIVLVAGDMQIAGCWTLNVCQSEQALIKSILSLMHDGHKHAAQEVARASRTPLPADRAQSAYGPYGPLTPRETEVAVLLTKGLINKEIAHRLNISLTTVISHRRSIMEKLRARSLADITIYCVLNGLVDVSEI